MFLDEELVDQYISHVENLHDQGVFRGEMKQVLALANDLHMDVASTYSLYCGLQAVSDWYETNKTWLQFYQQFSERFRLEDGRKLPPYKKWALERERRTARTKKKYHALLVLGFMIKHGKDYVGKEYSLPLARSLDQVMGIEEQRSQVTKFDPLSFHKNISQRVNRLKREGESEKQVIKDSLSFFNRINTTLFMG